MKIEIYKKGQGRYARIATFVAVMIFAIAGMVILSEMLPLWGVQTAYIRYGAPTALTLLMGLLMFWLVNRPKTADFLIATEGEMKKVSWSSKKEIVGSTKVVIITTFIMAVILFVVDLTFFRLFSLMGVL